MRLQELLSRRRVAAGSLGLALLAALAVACTDDSVTGVDEVQVPDRAAEELRVWDGLGVTVMTWNVYVGADLEKILTATSDTQLVRLVTEAFYTVIATNFPERAGAIADQVARFRPHLIGLQEISTIYRQSPGDFLVGNPLPANDVVFDYLQILLDTLEAHGLHYEVAGQVKNFDVEMPMLNQQTYQLDDVRVQDYEVVLARRGVGFSGVTQLNYQARLELNFLGMPIELPCGYVALNARVGHKTYRFVSTHLQATSMDPALVFIQLAQAQELVADLEDEKDPVIVVGDFNSPAPDGDTYQFMLDNGYVDTWTRNLNPYEGEGLTNPHEWHLMNPEVNFYQRIDFIFARNNIPISDEPAIGPVVATVVGDEQQDRTTPTGLWPSDHAGIVARLYLPVLGRFAGTQ